MPVELLGATGVAGRATAQVRRALANHEVETLDERGVQGLGILRLPPRSLQPTRRADPPAPFDSDDAIVPPSLEHVTLDARRPQEALTHPNGVLEPIGRDQRESPRRARRRFSAFAMGGEMGRIRPTNVFEHPGESRMTPPVTSMSSQVRSRISCLRQPAARRVRRRWWGRRFPTRAVRRGPDERRVGGRCQGRGPCEAWLGVHRRAVMPRTSFSTPRHVPSETLECHRSWPAM